MQLAITVFLTLLMLYFVMGILFGVYFLIKGANKIDPILAASKWKVKVLLFPGVVVTWPWLLQKIIKPKTS